MKQRASTLWSMDGCATEIVYRTDADRPLPDVSTKRKITKQLVTW